MGQRAARAASLALTALVICGAVLRIYAYLGNPSLWLDEAALARNILSRSFAGLLAPLDTQQVAPLGFLWLEKAAVSIFGTSEYALRLVPLLASIVALPLFAIVARRLLRPVASIFALALFATATPLLYFAAETKQYSLDVAVVLALFALAIPPLESAPGARAVGQGHGRRRLAVLAMAGLIAPWLSQPSVFALGGVALYLAIPFFRSRAGATRLAVAKRLLPVFALWAAGGGASIGRSLATMDPVTRSALDRFWERGFMPVADGVMASARWLGTSTHDLFAWLFPPIVAIAAIALFVAGVAALIRRSDGSASLMLAPLAFTLLASALRLYPVSYRLLLFTTPSLLIAVGAGAGWLLGLSRAPAATGVHGTERSNGTPAPRRPFSTITGYATCAALTLLALRSAMTMVEIPFYREELRPVVSYLARHRQSADVIYVYYGSAPAFQYYATRDGIPASAYLLGSCARDDWRSYVDEIDELRGHPRVWFVMSHPFVKGGIREDSLFLQSLAALGSRIDSASAIGAQLGLYDLSTAPGRSPAPGYVPPASGDSSAAGIGCSGAVSR